MDKIIEAIILGIVQGITEFLPISSSAHLEVFRWIFNWSAISNSFELALHFGTLLALVVVFFKEGITLIKSGFAIAITSIQNKLAKSNKAKLKLSDENIIRDGKIFWYIVAATIPAGIISLVLEKISEHIIGENTLLNIGLIGVASIVMGILLFFVDKKSKVENSFEGLTLKNTMLIGISQAFAAAFPGVSRSGVTITTSRALGYDRKSSAKLSFFLSIPLILAACIVKIPEFDFTYPVAFFLGIFVSFVVGVIVLKKLFEFLEKGEFKIFAIYRVAFGILLFIAMIIKNII